MLVFFVPAVFLLIATGGFGVKGAGMQVLIIVGTSPVAFLGGRLVWLIVYIIVAVSALTVVWRRRERQGVLAAERWKAQRVREQRSTTLDGPVRVPPSPSRE